MAENKVVLITGTRKGIGRALVEHYTAIGQHEAARLMHCSPHRSLSPLRFVFAKIVTYGTEPMPESTLHRFHEVLPNIQLQQTYGLSEVRNLAFEIPLLRFTMG